MSSGKVTIADTRLFRQCSIVPVMVTRSRPKITKPVRRAFYLREWRKFMGTKAIEIAIALDIERESYYRLEREWWTINAGEMDIIANSIGIKPSQLWFPPPAPGQQVISLDEMLEEMPENMQQAAILAVRGIAGR